APYVETPHHAFHLLLCRGGGFSPSNYKRGAERSCGKGTVGHDDTRWDNSALSVQACSLRPQISGQVAIAGHELECGTASMVNLKSALQRWIKKNLVVVVSIEIILAPLARC
ncbi:hypothetical protein PPTG_25025, partial [Phytophthora nicotianae INRA-310]